MQGIFISVDPGRDSPEHLAEYTRYFHPKIIGISGPILSCVQLSLFFSHHRCFFSTPLQADEVRIAVASNFSHAIKALRKTFEAQAQHRIILSYGATGRYYSQIINGAPFDIFLAADAKRPELLEKKGVIILGSRFTYAIGKLALWSSADNFVDQQAAVLTSKRFKHLAIANPKLSPYGKASKQFLKQQGLWKSLTSKMIRAENIAQSFQFVKSGNVELGFVALSHVKQLGENEKGSLWIVPTDTYTPIKQQAVLLKDKPAAKMLARVK